MEQRVLKGTKPNTSCRRFQSLSVSLNAIFYRVYSHPLQVNGRFPRAHKGHDGRRNLNANVRFAVFHCDLILILTRKF